MSEYQYYEFQAIDRPLTAADRAALRDISSRARITGSSFSNSYEWGSFKGDPDQFMERWFDLHLYLANWGSRRLMIRLPRRLIDRDLLDTFLREVDCAEIQVAGDNLVLDIARDEVEPGDWDDGSGWLAALTPLRADVLGGDLRLFYLLWLTAVEADIFEADAAEPLPGIGPLTAALSAFADFFDIDPDLVRAAAERAAVATPGASTSPEVGKILSDMADGEKAAMLARLLDGDPHVGTELRAKVRSGLATGFGTSAAAARAVGELRARARAIGFAREQAAAEKLAAEERRRAERAEEDRQARLGAIMRRGEGVWREVESEIERRDGHSYDKATSLLSDLKAIAEAQGTTADFLLRLRAIRERHARKARFIERLAALG